MLSLLPQLAWKGSVDQGTRKPTSTGGETCGRKKGHADGFDPDQSIPFQWLLVETHLNRRSMAWVRPVSLVGSRPWETEISEALISYPRQCLRAHPLNPALMHSHVRHESLVCSPILYLPRKKYEWFGGWSRCLLQCIHYLLLSGETLEAVVESA